MINKTSKFILIIFILIISGCSGNRFKDGETADVFTFGLFGRDNFDFCKRNDPEFMKPYLNEKYPGKICTRYRAYTCHINHYCNDDKNCEEDAAQYWTPLWNSAHGNIEKRVEITKRSCDIEQQHNSIQKK